MRKISKLVMMAVIALGVGFTACNNDDIDVPKDGQKGNTHVAVALKLGKGAGLRALPNDYNYVEKWGGNDEITSITVFVSDASEVVYKKYTVGAGEAYEMVDNVVTPMTVDAAIKTTSGWKEVYVLVNATTQAETHLGAAGLNGTLANVADFKSKYADILKLENSFHDGTDFVVSTSADKLAEVVDVAGDKKDAIMMTNIAPQTITVAPNIDAAATLNGQNRVSLEVERAVARVMVTTKETSYNVPTADGTATLGTLDNITWVLAQGENSLFVQRKSNWDTPNFGWVPGVGSNDYITQAGDIYDYSGLYENYDAATQFGGTAVLTIADYSTAPAIGQESILKGKFVLPNTHAPAPAPVGDDAYTGGYRKGNTAYVMVRAKFTPTTFSDAAGTTPTYTDGTFWLGENGKFYQNEEEATQTVYDVDGPDPTVVLSSQNANKYVGGKVIYYAWVNPDVQPNWYNSPVIRNNIYHIHITGFKTIGTNWNPLFPEDPDNPKAPEDGGNPDPKPEGPEGPNPIDPEDPLTTPETYMSVDVTVLEWLIHSYEVELGI